MKKMLIIVVALLAVFFTGTAALAVDVVLGGEFTLKFGDSFTADQSVLHWWEFQVMSYKNFEQGTAYLKMKATPETTPRITGYGYTYKFSDHLSLTGKNDSDGELLAESRVIKAGYDWKDDYYMVNGNHRMFVNKTVLKVDSSPWPGMTATVAVVPKQFLLKGEYVGTWFKAGGGYTNTTDGYSEGILQNRPLYCVYGEIFPLGGVNLYGEYMEGSRYLLEGNYTLHPLSLDVTYGNLSYEKAGQPTYKAYTLDADLAYELSYVLSLKGGMAYYLTEKTGLASAYGGVATGPWGVKVLRDFDTEATLLLLECALDGVNTLIGEYNFTTGKYSLELYVNMW